MFHVPGESALELIDALNRKNLRLISCRHEGGMPYMAQAAGHLRDQPGICVVGRAPGALIATLALHTAWTDAAPMIPIIRQATLHQAGRAAFLGPEFHAALSPMAKWVGEVSDAARPGDSDERPARPGGAGGGRHRLGDSTHLRPASTCCSPRSQRSDWGRFTPM